MGCRCSSNVSASGQRAPCLPGTSCCRRHPRIAQCGKGRGSVSGRSVDGARQLGLSALLKPLSRSAGVPLFGINPCIIDQPASRRHLDLFLVRITPLSLCSKGVRRTRRHEEMLSQIRTSGFWGLTGDALRDLRHQSSSLLWERGAAHPLLSLHEVEDVRGVVAAGELWLIAGSLHGGGTTRAGRQVLIRRSWPALTPLGGPVELRWAAGEVTVEKNWIPFLSEDGRVLVSYSLQPHLVLRCGAVSGRCSVLHNTSTRLWQQRLSDFRGLRLLHRNPASPSEVRGGTTCVALLERSVCTAHWCAAGRVGQRAVQRAPPPAPVPSGRRRVRVRMRAGAGTRSPRDTTTTSSTPCGHGRPTTSRTSHTPFACVASGRKTTARRIATVFSTQQGLHAAATSPTRR